MRKNFSLAAEKNTIRRELTAARSTEMAMYRHLRNAGEHWILVKEALGERGINIAKWAKENLPCGRQWMDRHAELFKRWTEFLEAKTWAAGQSYSLDRRPGLELAFDLMEVKKRSDVQSSARVRAHDLSSQRTRSVACAESDHALPRGATSPPCAQSGVGRAPLILNPTTTVWHGDCTAVMQAYLQDNSVDVVIADVPYFLSQREHPIVDHLLELNGMRPRFNEDWDRFESIDQYEAFCRGWIGEALRVLDAAGSLFVLGTFHNIGLINRILRVQETEIVHHICWLKRNSMPHLATRRLQMSHETILWAVKTKGYRFRYRACKVADYPGDAFKKAGLQMRDIWDIPTRSRDATGHPASKPVELYRRMLDVAGKANGLLLDPFAGGGTGAIAAMEWGMRSWSIERDARYVEMIKSRVLDRSRSRVRHATAKSGVSSDSAT